MFMPLSARPRFFSGYSFIRLLIQAANQSFIWGRRWGGWGGGEPVKGRAGVPQVCSAMWELRTASGPRVETAPPGDLRSVEERTT